MESKLTRWDWDCKIRHLSTLLSTTWHFDEANICSRLKENVNYFLFSFQPIVDEPNEEEVNPEAVDAPPEVSTVDPDTVQDQS